MDLSIYSVVRLKKASFKRRLLLLLIIPCSAGPRENPKRTAASANILLPKNLVAAGERTAGKLFASCKSDTRAT